jgi:hypothetical protein
MPFAPNKSFFEEEGISGTMDGRRDLNLLSQIGSWGILWIISTTNVLPLLVMDNQIGYGVVLKMSIEMSNCILSTIELVAKTLKTYDKQEVCK